MLQGASDKKQRNKSSHMKNLLIIHQSAELYGSDKALLLLLSRLDKTLYCPVVVLPSEGPLKQELELLEIKVVIAPVLKLYRKMFTPGNMLRFLKEIRIAVRVLDELHKTYNFSLVYSNTLAVLLGMIYARRKKIAHVWHVHEIIVHPKLIATTFPKLLKAYADVVVCNSYATKENLTSHIDALANKCVVVHNGLDADMYSNISGSKADYGFSENDIVVTLIGRISRLKGHRWLLNTYINFLKDSGIKLLFVGSPVPGQEYYLTEVEQMIDESGLNENVKIIPFTKNLAAAWAVTDIAVVPSTEAESFGLVALEGMLAHKPVIGSDHGGLKEIIEHDATGWLVEPSNEQKLAEAIAALAKDSRLREEFGQKGYQRAVSLFSLDSYVAGMEKVFAETAKPVK